MFARTMAAACVMSLAIQTAVPSDADWHWLFDNRDAAFESLMPVALSANGLVAYRSYRDLYQEVQERYFRIEWADGPGFDKDRLPATVVVPMGRSIQQQLLDAHMRDRRASFKSVLATVGVRRLTFSADKCAAVRTRADALSATAMSLPARDDLAIHPMVHRIVIEMMTAHIDATVYDPHNPIVLWATETADAILACAG